MAVFITREQTNWWIDTLTERNPTEITLSLPLRVRLARIELLESEKLLRSEHRNLKRAIGISDLQAKVERRIREGTTNVEDLRAFLAHAAP